MNEQNLFDVKGVCICLTCSLFILSEYTYNFSFKSLNIIEKTKMKNVKGFLVGVCSVYIRNLYQ